MTEENACEGTERKPREDEASRESLVQQVNKCTILSPDMSIQELAMRLTSVGLSLSDVRVKPLVHSGGVKARDRAFIEAIDAVHERWGREILSGLRK